MARLKNDFCKDTIEWASDYRTANVRNDIPVMDLDDRLRRLENLILTPSPSQLEKYPALKEAYEQFIIIRRLTIENEKP